MQNNSLHGSCGTQRSVDRSEDVLVEYPVGVISVALLLTVVQRPIIYCFNLCHALQQKVSKL